MCGINGFISLHRDPHQIIKEMNRHLRHRGPDGDGIFLDVPLALGHVRLSILDLTNAGAQPMSYGRWVLVFNGEIYNFEALRDVLISKGYAFSSRSDTEVLLKAWHCWEEKCLDKIEGMFAFAIYDTGARRLHICRDGYGVKPLFYSYRNNEFIFSSELSTLVHMQSKLPSLDYDALASYLALHYVPAPQTGFNDVYKLPAGHIMTVMLKENCINTSEPVRWDDPYTPSDEPSGIDLDDLDQTLSTSVRQQMVSDVPVGAFLSGGVDSSLICHYASRLHSEPLHTFSIGFTDAGPEYDESLYAARAAEILGARHHAVCIEIGSLFHYIDEILDKMGELNADSSVFLNYIVCSAAREHVTVCLSGAGGDELFGGYYRYQALLALDILRRIPFPLTRLLRNLLNPLPQNRDSRLGNLTRRVIRFLDQREGDNGFVTISRHDRLYPQHSYFLNRPPLNTLLQAMEFDFRYYLCDNIFSFSDKMSMLHGLEVRVPFLDPGVVRLAQRMQNSQRVRLYEKKVLLKQLAARYFPRDLIYRKKQGFAAPVEVWLRQLPKTELKRRCMEGLATQLLSESVIDDLVESFMERSRDLSLQIYALMVMNRWYAQIGK